MFFNVYRDVDYDEMAWELEKCLTYHFIAPSSGKNQMIMNEEATMARRGLGIIILTIIDKMKMNILLGK